MKKLLIPIICFAFFGCSKSSNRLPKVTSPPTILGTWYLSSDTSYTYDNGQLIKTIEHAYGPNNTDNIIEYNQAGIATVMAVDNEYIHAIDTISTPYKILGDSIYYGNIDTGFIRQLTSTQLTIYFDISGIVNFDQDGAKDSTVFQRITTVDHYRR